MGAWPLSWWQKVRQRRVAISATTAIIVIAIVLIIVGYRFDWAGFNGYTQVSTIRILSGPTAGTVTRTELYQPGKTLWDWMQLLFIPVALALVAIWFNRNERKNEQKIASDNQQETALQAYLDRLSELLMKEGLRTSQPEDEVRTVARVRTLTVLHQLDEDRKTYVIQFLYESDLVCAGVDKCIIDLTGADLNKADFFRPNGTDLSGVCLIGAELNFAVFTLANLVQADLSEAELIGAEFIETDLNKADLSEANLRKALLKRADLSEANLSRANLRGAIFSKANLRGADLTGANLKGVTGITVERLVKQVKSLKGATMPDGSIHS